MVPDYIFPSMLCPQKCKQVSVDGVLKYDVSYATGYELVWLLDSQGYKMLLYDFHSVLAPLP